MSDHRYAWMDYVINMESIPEERERLRHESREGHIYTRDLFRIAKKRHWTKEQFDRWIKTKGEDKPPLWKEPKAILVEKGIWHYPARKKKYRGFSRVGGGKLRYCSSNSLDEVRRWKRAIDQKADEVGPASTYNKQKKILVSEVLYWHLEEYIKKIPGGFSPLDRSCQYYTELRLLNIASEHYLFDRPVLSIESQDVYDYLYKREHGAPLKKGGQSRDPVTKDTIQRELTRWRAAFNRAKERNGEYKYLPNPFAKIDLEYTPTPRDRILKKGELKKLLDACEDCHERNRIYVPLAIFLSIETGMREGEILALRWKDINFDERTIVVTETKTRKVNGVSTRTIVLPFWSMQILSSMAMSLQLELQESGIFNSDKYIFSINEEAFIQTFAKLVKRVKKNDKDFEHLQFRDLRSTAASRFNNEVRLTESEVALMLGHYNRKNITRSFYIKTKLDVIREQIDKYTLKQMPLDLFVYDTEALLKMPMKEAFERIPFPSVRGAIKISKSVEEAAKLHRIEQPPYPPLDVLSFVKAHASKY